MTNAEKIRNMSTEELAKYFSGFTSCRPCPARATCIRLDELQTRDNIIGCKGRIKVWLESEAEE